MSQVPGKMIKDASVTGAKLVNATVTEIQLNTSVAGNGLTGGGGSPLAVGAAATTSGISVSADAIAVSIKSAGALEIEATGQGELDVKDLGIDAARLAAGAVTEAKIGTGAVTEAKIGTGAVTETKIGTSAVTTDKIGNDQVTQDKIAASAVGNTELASEAVTPAKMDLSSQTYDFSSATLRAADPIADSDVVTKSYVDAIAQGLDIKDSCRVLATTNQSLSGFPTIDGIQTVEGDRVLLTGQTNQVDNGMWTVSTVAWSRPVDFQAGSSAAGAFTFIEEGTDNHDSGWVCTSDQPYDIVDTHALEFTQFSGAGAITAGAGLDKTGNEIFVTELANSAIDVQTTGSKVAVDNSTVEIATGTPGSLRVKSGGITETHLNSSVAGNGLTGGAGSPLAVGATNDSISVATNGIKAAVPVRGDKNLTASVTSSDGDAAMAATISYTPPGDSMVGVLVNGVQMNLKGDKTGDCYFSDDGGTTARALTAITSGDSLHWNGSVAGFQLDANDRISLNYVLPSEPQL